MVSNESLVLVKNYIILITMLVLLKAPLIISHPRTNHHCPVVDCQRLKGMNHNSFAYEVAPEGTPDGWVLVGDLKEEISQEGAITSITEFAAHFMDFCQR